MPSAHVTKKPYRPTVGHAVDDYVPSDSDDNNRTLAGLLKEMGRRPAPRASSPPVGDPLGTIRRGRAGKVSCKEAKGFGDPY